MRYDLLKYSKNILLGLSVLLSACSQLDNSTQFIAKEGNLTLQTSEYERAVQREIAIQGLSAESKYEDYADLISIVEWEQFMRPFWAAEIEAKKEAEAEAQKIVLTRGGTRYRIWGAPS